jgi:hypothetical protein
LKLRSSRADVRGANLRFKDQKLAATITMPTEDATSASIGLPRNRADALPVLGQAPRQDEKASKSAARQSRRYRAAPAVGVNPHQLYRPVPLNRFSRETIFGFTCVLNPRQIRWGMRLTGDLQGWARSRC